MFQRWGIQYLDLMELCQEVLREQIAQDNYWQEMQCDEKKLSIERKAQTFEYSLFGTLDITKGILKSVINFEIDKEELYNYGYLDGKQVKVDVLRIDFVFE